MTTTEHPKTTPSGRHPADRRDPSTPGELPPALFILHDLADRIEQYLTAVDQHTLALPGLVPYDGPTISVLDAHTLRQVARGLEHSVAGQRGIERRQLPR